MQRQHEDLPGAGSDPADGGLQPDGAEPSLYAWLGGNEVLRTLTRVFYDDFVAADPLIGPLFTDAAPDHPERVADWLGEVFGGPAAYSQERGGYPHMVREHLGKHLTEAQRARWVALMVQAADTVGLAADPEFRSAFSAYLEWGSRLALENSQPGARPPLGLPVPRWDWGTAGPPGRRLDPRAAPTPPPSAGTTVSGSPVLPAAGEAVSFARHVQPLFRDRDRASMRFAFDLWSHADVSRHAEAVLARLENGTMPCDGPWPTGHVEVFRRWAAGDRPA